MAAFAHNADSRRAAEDTLKPFPRPKAKARQVDLVGEVIKRQAAGVEDAKISGVDAKPVKVGVGPIQSNLEGMVKIGDRAVTGDQKAAPDHRADAPQHNLKLINNGFDWFEHSAILSRRC